MVSDRRARKLFLLCNKLGIDGVKRYVEEGRFGAEKLPLINAWIEIRLEKEKTEALKALKEAKKQDEKPVKKVAKKSKKVAKKS